MASTFMKLRGRIREMGFTNAEVAKKIGINPSTFQIKLSGARDFTLTEIKMIGKLLNLSSIDEYFFAE